MEFVNFFDFKNQITSKEGIVLLGAGGDLNEWVNGVANLLNKEGIASTANPDELFAEKYILKTTGGRTDLALIVNFDKVELGKLVMWRLTFGDCSWVSDYIVNYENQHYSV